MQRHLGAAKDSKATQCQGPATIYIKNLDKTSFPNRTVKTFSVATHFFRGIILNISKSLRCGTSDFMKLSKWDYVGGVLNRTKIFCLIFDTMIERVSVSRMRDFLKKELETSSPISSPKINHFFFLVFINNKKSIIIIKRAQKKTSLVVFNSKQLV